MSQPTVPQTAKKKITLPGDQSTQLFVLSMASNSIMYRIYTPERYKNEVLSQEVTGLSKLSRDIEAGYNRRLAAEKRLIGRMTEIGGTSLVKRPPNWLTILIILFVGAGIVAYGQYNLAFSSSVSQFWDVNSGYIVVSFILFLAFLLLWRYRRRRKQ